MSEAGRPVAIVTDADCMQVFAQEGYREPWTPTDFLRRFPPPFRRHAFSRRFIHYR